MKKLNIYKKNNSLDKIYKYFKFNPVEFGLSKKKFKAFKKQRESLFHDHLKIQLSSFKNKSLLEFGPANGEKTLIYLEQGANITAVEPNKDFIRIFKNRIKKKNFKINIQNKYIENFVTKKKFDFIILENCLTSIDKREKSLRKLSKMLKKDGLIIFTYHNPEGFFLEYFKKYILEVYSKIKNKNEINEILNLSKAFFKRKFQKISHTRKFEQYVLDTLILNSFIHKTFWNFKDIIRISNKSNLRFYSSWPNYVSNQTRWHKKHLTTKKHNLDILKNYQKIKGSFYCKDLFFEKTDMQLLKIIQKLMIYEKNKILSAKKIINLIIKSKKSKQFFFQNIFNTLKNLSPKNYNKNFNFNDWGYPNHYLVFKRND